MSDDAGGGEDYSEDLERYIEEFTSFLPIAVCDVTSVGIITSVNRTFREMTRYEETDVVGKPMESIFLEADAARKALDEVLSTTSIKGREYTLLSNDGSRTPVSVSLSVRKDKGGVIIGYFLALSDISSLKEFQGKLEEKVRGRTAELNAAYEELKQLDSLKTEFMLVTSHELSSPLTSIISLTQLMLGGQTDEQTRRKHLDVILRNSKRLSRMVRNIVEFGRIEAGHLSFKVAVVDMNAIVETVCSELEPLAQKKGVEIFRSYPPEPAYAKADPHRIDSVISNLVDNAIKFTPNGGKIGVRVEFSDGLVVVSVSDTGIGIAQDKLAKVFDKFYQVDSGPFRTYGGVGIGLTIAKRIIEAHDGRIWVESEPEKGSTFHFSLARTQP